MNPNNPNRLRIVAAVQRATEQGEPIRSYRELSVATGLSFSCAMDHALELEAKRLLTRDQHGSFVLLAAANDERPGIRPLTPEEIQEARGASARKAKPKARPGWLRGLIMNNEMPVPEGPGDAVLGEQLVTAETLAQKLAAERKSAPRNVAPKRQRYGFYNPEPLPEVPLEHQLPMPRALSASARKLGDDIRERELAADLAHERRMAARMALQAANEEREASSGKFCPRCANQPWRRAQEGVCLCGGRYEPERVEIILERFSPIALC